MKPLSIVVASVVCLFSGIAAAEQPVKGAFGLMLGERVKDAMLKSDREKSKYIIGSYAYGFYPKHPHPALKRYNVWISPKTRTVVAIRADYVRFSDSLSNRELRSTYPIWHEKFRGNFKELVALLDVRYRRWGEMETLRKNRLMAKLSNASQSYEDNETDNWIDLAYKCQTKIGGKDSFIGCHLRLEYRLGDGKRLAAEEAARSASAKGL